MLVILIMLLSAVAASVLDRRGVEWEKEKLFLVVGVEGLLTASAEDGSLVLVVSPFVSLISSADTVLQGQKKDILITQHMQYVTKLLLN